MTLCFLMLVVLFFALTWKAASRPTEKRWPTHAEFEANRRRMRRVLNGHTFWEIQ